MTGFTPSQTILVSGKAITPTENPITVQSNTASGLEITPLSNESIDDPTRTLIEDADGLAALSETGALNTGDTPIYFHEQASFQVVVNDVSQDGKQGVRELLTVNVLSRTVSLVDLTLDNDETMAGLIEGHIIATITGFYTEVGYLPGVLDLCANTSGAPYTGGKVKLDIFDKKLRSGASPIADGETVSFYIREQFSGSTHYTAVTITGVEAVAPSAPVITNNDGVHEFQNPVTTMAFNAHSTSPNPNDVIRYSISASRFEIDSHSGQGFVGGDLDRAVATSHDVTVRATGASGLYAETTFTINVLPWSYHALDSALFGTTVRGHLDADYGSPTLTGSNIDQILGADGTVWNKVGSTGPELVAAAHNGRDCIRSDGAKALKTTKAEVVALLAGVTSSPTPGKGAVPKEFSIFMVLKNTYTGANQARYWTFLNNATSLMRMRQQANNAGVDVNSSTTQTAVPADGNLHAMHFGYELLDPYKGPTGSQYSLDTVVDGLPGGSLLVDAVLDANAFVLMGDSASVAPTNGMIGDLCELFIVEGCLYYEQIDMLNRAMKAKWGIPAATFDATVDVHADFHRTYVSDFSGPEPVWYDPDKSQVGNGWTPTLLNAQVVQSGSAQVGNPEQAWYWDPRFQLAQPYIRNYKHEDGALVLIAQKNPSRLLQYTGPNLPYGGGVGYEPPTGVDKWYWGGAAMTQQDQLKHQYGYTEARGTYTPGPAIWTGWIWGYGVSGSGPTNDKSESDKNENFGHNINVNYFHEQANQPIRHMGWGHHSNDTVNADSEQTVRVPDFGMNTGIPIIFGEIWDPDVTRLVINRKIRKNRYRNTNADWHRPQTLLNDITVTVTSDFTVMPDETTPNPAYLKIFSILHGDRVLAAPSLITGTHAKKTAFVAAVNSAGGSVSGGEQSLLNDFFNYMDSWERDALRAGVSLGEKMDGAFCFAFADPKAQLMDLYRCVAATIAGTGTLTSGAHWQGNGTTGYIDTGYDIVPNTGAGKLSSTHQRLDTFVASAPTASAKRGLAGSYICGHAIDPITGNLNHLSANTTKLIPATRRGVFGPVIPSLGLMTMTRYAMTGYVARQPLHSFLNGDFHGIAAVPTGGNTLDTGQTTFTAGKNHLIGAMNLSSSIVYGDAKIGFHSWGAGISPREAKPLYDGIKALLHGLNPTVYPS